MRLLSPLLNAKIRVLNESSSPYFYLSSKVSYQYRYQNKWLPEYPFVDRTLETVDTTPTYLTEDEVNIIYNKELKTDSLNKVRDIFIFACLTGYSYAEIFRIEKEKHLQLIDGDWWIIIKRQKTDVQQDVRLTGEALELANKYKVSLESDVTGKLFPVRSNQKMNDFLKTIGTLCELDKVLTCHVARHTFATTAINRNMDPKDVQVLMGHKHPRMTSHYARVLKPRTSKAMDKMEGILVRNDRHLNVA